MALADLLSQILSTSASGAPNGAIDPGQSTAPGTTGGTPVSELVVNAQRKSQPAPQSAQMAPQQQDQQLMSDPGYNPPPSTSTDQSAQPSNINYNNSQQTADVNSAVQGEGPPPGGMANPGLYGVLPQNLQHGTLRNVLGALGDALLVSGGRQPEYEQRMQQQQIGQAMAGMDINDPQSVSAAVQRVASTGAPGAAEMADKLQQQAEQAALRKQYMEYNQNYRQQVMDDRTQYHAQESEARNQNLLKQRGQSYSGLAVQATTAAAYKAIYDRADASAKQLDPKYSGEDMGLVRPEDWTPGAMAGFGQTGNNVVQSQDRDAQRHQSQINAQINAGSRVQSAGITAGAHVTGANIGANRTSDATILQSLTDKQNSGQALTPAEQVAWNHLTQVSHPQRGLAGTNSVVGAAAGGQIANGGSVPTLTPQQAAKLPRGTHFRTTDGRVLVRQ